MQQRQSSGNSAAPSTSTPVAASSQPAPVASTSTPATSSSAPAGKIKVTLLTKATGGFWDAMIAGAKKYASDHPDQVELDDKRMQDQ